SPQKTASGQVSSHGRDYDSVSRAVAFESAALRSHTYFFGVIFFICVGSDSGDSDFPVVWKTDSSQLPKRRSRGASQEVASHRDPHDENRRRDRRAFRLPRGRVHEIQTEGAVDTKRRGHKAVQISGSSSLQAGLSL